MTTNKQHKENDLSETNSKCSSGFDFEAKVHISKELMVAIISTVGVILTNLFLN
jgi:hypothetical protein